MLPSLPSSQCAYCPSPIELLSQLHHCQHSFCIIFTIDCIIVNTLSIPRLELIVTAGADCRMLMFVARSARFPAVFTSLCRRWGLGSFALRGQIPCVCSQVVHYSAAAHDFRLNNARRRRWRLWTRSTVRTPLFFWKRHKPRPLFCCPKPRLLQRC